MRSTGREAELARSGRALAQAGRTRWQVVCVEGSRLGPRHAWLSRQAWKSWHRRDAFRCPAVALPSRSSACVPTPSTAVHRPVDAANRGPAVDGAASGLSRMAQSHCETVFRSGTLGANQAVSVRRRASRKLTAGERASQRKPRGLSLPPTPGNARCSSRARFPHRDPRRRLRPTPRSKAANRRVAS